MRIRVEIFLKTSQYFLIELHRIGVCMHFIIMAIMISAIIFDICLKDNKNNMNSKIIFIIYIYHIALPQQ